MREETTTNLHNIKKGHKFAWGEVVAIHEIGPYSIVEATSDRNDGEPAFYLYVDGNDTSSHYYDLDGAIAAGIAYRHEGPNHNADTYFMCALYYLDKMNDAIEDAAFGDREEP